MKKMLSMSLAALCCGALAATAVQAEPDVQLKGPSGGWTHSGLVEDDSRVTYAYPNNLIDRGGQRHRTLIEGRLKAAAAAGRQAPQLIVNGNALPLYTDAQGAFARPYAFGAGSNGFELRSGEGQVLKRVQFFEANHAKTTARVRIVLAWDDPQAELDLHVITPDGGHAFWGDPVLGNGGGMDLDSVDGAGPEMFSMTAPMSGAYHVVVNYWGNFGPAGYHFDEKTRQRQVITARITLVFDENQPAERRETFTVPMRKIGDLMRVRSFLRG